MRKPTGIQQVAQRAGVSQATVSRVLNGFPGVRETTLLRVRKAVEALHYVPNTSARNLRIGRSQLFGLIVSDIKNPFFPELIDNFERLAAGHNIDLIFTHTNYDSKRLAVCLQRLVERNVDGIAIMTSEVDQQALSIATRHRVPLVLLNQPSLSATFHDVAVDYSSGFREAVTHLRDLGHTHIGFISGPAGFSSARRRRDAFRLAMRHLHLPLRKESIAIGDFRVQGGVSAMHTLLAIHPRPTAILATNDLMAVGALQAAQSAGLHVPNDLSIIGFDDLPIASMVHPPLTTIRLSREDIAQQAFATLLALSLSRRPIPRDRVRPALIIRGSTGAPQRVP